MRQYGFSENNRSDKEYHNDSGLPPLGFSGNLYHVLLGLEIAKETSQNNSQFHSQPESKKRNNAICKQYRDHNMAHIYISDIYSEGMGYIYDNTLRFIHDINDISSTYDVD